MNPPPNNLPDQASREVSEDSAAQLAARSTKESADVPLDELQMELYEEALKETDWGHQPC